MINPLFYLLGKPKNENITFSFYLLQKFHNELIIKPIIYEENAIKPEFP